jgi:hypothetical protein
MKRITNLKTGKNEEFIKRQWVHVGALRDRLITATEWTQNGDNLLTLESFILWSDWRRKVYDVTDATFDTPESAEAALNDLSDNKPASINTSTVMRQKKYRLDMSSLDAAKRDGKRIVKEYTANFLAENLPENINVITLKYQSCLAWQASNFFDFMHFPLLEAHRKIHDLSINDTIDSINSLHKLATEQSAELISKEFDIIQTIEEAPNLRAIITVIKQMHGY